MSLLKRLEEWWRAKSAERAASAKSEQQSMRADGPSEESEADAELDVMDAGSGTGATL
jgi:hypothetical protein